MKTVHPRGHPAVPIRRWEGVRVLATALSLGSVPCFWFLNPRLLSQPDPGSISLPEAPLRGGRARGCLHGVVWRPGLVSTGDPNHEAFTPCKNQGDNRSPPTCRREMKGFAESFELGGVTHPRTRKCDYPVIQKSLSSVFTTPASRRLSVPGVCEVLPEQADSLFPVKGFL